MRNIPRIPFRHFVTLLIAAAFVLPSLVVHYRNLAAADPVRTSTVCLDCHSGMDSTLVGTPHQLPAVDDAKARIACTDCHSGDSRHWEEDPEQYPMTKPAGLGATAEAALCATCHQNSHQQNMAERNVHVVNDVNCSGCHAVHSAKAPSLLKEAQWGLCLDCHGGVEGQFARPYRHPVSDGVIQCSECHMTLDETRRELSLNGTNVCMKCHGEFEGPFPFEHHATLDYSTEEGGCLNCHEPHGSSHPRMLEQPYEPPHYQLCTQCHSIPPKHLSNAVHGTKWQSYACNDCHVDIHGSYSNRLFVNESLEAQGCFNSGCHHL